MARIDKPDYGNWVPRKVIVAPFLLFCVSCVLAVVIDIGVIRVILIISSVVFGVFFIYMGYAYWRLWINDGELQKQFCDALLKQLEWDGQGRALDIGTGSGRVATALAGKFPSVQVLGIDYWGNPWAYSKNVCEKNAEIEGLADRVGFQRDNAISLTFEGGEYDLVTSNFVFHSINVKDRKLLIKEALRVLKDGGAFAFQDLFNKQFYGDISLFLDDIKTWG
ncbi:class I SAM-dependent methyltransferase [Chloroflexota bacterium]